ncbi:type VI secretion system protein TssR domain-containing protein [Halpernia frigidisoli]|uniref:VWFA domain-containing protein n=1 Tax=Halpernia frigidisoli TaxID=1125876 RepID=A0A1I3IPH7_9FLAO|nr:type VI secretion system protein TssR domain-containing protein [Halpernia frigidisoli]SFI49770.1 hypothetical protein SAMN05443292_2719 [Halpernia frigidisoli]
MKHKLLKSAYIFPVSLIIIGCNVRIPSNSTPTPSDYGIIDQVKITNGFPIKKEPWVVISDRNSNVVFMKKGDEKSPKEIKFLEPLLVLKRRDSRGLVQVAEYNQNALLQKLPPKSVKTYGWIPEDQLLLWTNSVKNSANGFNLKATLTPNKSDVLKNGEKYLKNDSVLVFSSPDLTNQTKVKLPIGQLVYIYKKAYDGKRFLIGKSPSVKIDSIAGNIYGWVSSNIVTVWGDNSALRVSPDYKITGENNLSIKKDTYGTASTTAFSASDAINREPLENIISTMPLDPKMLGKGKFYTNALDYSKNFIYNILGQPLYYPRYKEILAGEKNLNIVLTVDASGENDQNIAVAKSTLQELSLKAKNNNYFRNIKFGAVLFKNNSCGESVAASELSADPEKVSQYIDKQLISMKCNGNGGQPMQEGMEMAGQVLASHKDETNVVILIGSNSNYQSNMVNAISTLSAARARIISYQTYSGTSESANNFVLLSENIITNSGKNIAELEKERIADQSLILNKNDYSLLQQEEGLYSLDYPKKSMWQGFVIYPKKGEFNSSALLSKSLDSLLSQANAQNIKLERSLTKYFQSSIANTKTEIRPDFRSEFADVPVPLPSETSAQFVKYSNPFFTKGTYTEDFKNAFPIVQKGILISVQEYDRLRFLYEEIYKETLSFSKSFSQSSALNSYLKVLKKYSLLKDKDLGDLNDKNMAYSVTLSTGFDTSSEEILTKYMIDGWRDSKIIPEDAVRAYFKQYRMLADRLMENKNNPVIKIDQNGETYYWLSNYFAPMISPQETL